MEDQKRLNSGQAASSLSACVVRYFHDSVAREQGISIQVDPGDLQPSPEGRDCRCRLQFTLPDGTLLDGALRTENVGGNMYSVEARVGGGRSRTFSVCLVKASGTGDGSARRVCDFLLYEIKRIMGEQWLREMTARIAAGQEAHGSPTYEPNPS